MDQLVVTHRSGTSAGLEQRFDVHPGTTLTIGRDPLSDIRLDPDREGIVSRVHARIIAHSSRVIWLELVDKESMNGTFINGRWIRGRIALVPGDRIRLGYDGPELEVGVEAAPKL
ncbi:MAG: FHA domain-containing protein [Gemmatimonadales bacterium]|nr:FHA domain-containing protein [Gemmatimonadales bacterium]